MVSAAASWPRLSWASMDGLLALVAGYMGGVVVLRCVGGAMVAVYMAGAVVASW